MNYKKQKTPNGGAVIWHEVDGVRTSFGDNLAQNTDYQAYLAWLAEGNEPEVIDLSG